MEGKCTVLMIRHCTFLFFLTLRHTLFCFERWSVIYHLLGMSAFHKPGGSTSEGVHARGSAFNALCVCACVRVAVLCDGTS